MIVMLAKLVPYLIRERASRVLLYAVHAHAIRSKDLEEVPCHVPLKEMSEGMISDA